MAEKKRVPVALTDKQLRDLESVKKETGLSRSGILALAFTEWFEQRERGKSSA